jgi:hypothetical protein
MERSDSIEQKGIYCEWTLTISWDSTAGHYTRGHHWIGEVRFRRILISQVTGDDPEIIRQCLNLSLTEAIRRARGDWPGIMNGDHLIIP